MVKLTSIQLYKYQGPEKEPTLLGLASDLSSFGYFQRCVACVHTLLLQLQLNP